MSVSSTCILSHIYMLTLSFTVTIVIGTSDETAAAADKQAIEAKILYEVSLPSKRQEESACNFHLFPNMLAGGNEFRKVRDGTDIEECQKVCSSHYDSFFCAGVLVRHRSACYITGFQVRDNFWSKHYHRTCSLGPGCFKPESGISMEGTQVVPIPQQYVWNDWTRSLYCMAQCETYSTCVGFDLLSHSDKKSKCYLAILKAIPNTNFNLYLRRC